MQQHNKAWVYKGINDIYPITKVYLPLYLVGTVSGFELLKITKSLVFQRKINPRTQLGSFFISVKTE